MNDQRYLFIHVHIRKCGGITFSHIMKKNFGEAFYRDDGIIHEQYLKDDFVRIINNCPWLLAYSSHKASLDLPYDTVARKIRVICFVRDPVDRFISHYFYHRQNERNWLPKTKELTLSEYIQYALIEKNIYNYKEEGPFDQIEYLTGEKNLNSLRKVKKLIDDGMLHLFPIERFNHACILLRKMYPAHFKKLGHVKKNTSPRSHVIRNEDISMIKRQICAHEYELLSLANKYLDNSIKFKFKDKSEFDVALEILELESNKAHRKKLLQNVLKKSYKIIGRYI